jgi:hypothetical protein
MLAGAIVRAVEGDTLVLSHESAPLAKRLAEQRNSNVIREALKDALGVDWKIRCEAGTAAPQAEPEPEAVAPSPPQRDDDEEMAPPRGTTPPRSHGATGGSRARSYRRASLSPRIDGSYGPSTTDAVEDRQVIAVRVELDCQGTGAAERYRL